VDVAGRSYRGLNAVNIGANPHVSRRARKGQRMGRKTLVVVSLICGLLMTTGASPAAGAPAMANIAAVPGRTAIAFRSIIPGVLTGARPINSSGAPGCPS